MTRAERFIKQGYENSKELMNMLQFLWRRAERETGFMAFKQLQTLEDYIDFAQKWFPAQSLPKAIVDFLAFLQPYQPKTVAEVSINHSAMTFLLGQALPSVSQIIALHRYYENRMSLRYFAKHKQKMNLLTTAQPLLGDQRLDLLVIGAVGEVLKEHFLYYQPFLQQTALIACYPVQETEFFQQLQNCYRYEVFGTDKQRLGVIHYIERLP